MRQVAQSCAIMIFMTAWPAAATHTPCLVESKKNGRTYENTSKVCRNAPRPAERTFTLATGRESLDSGMTLASSLEASRSVAGAAACGSRVASALTASLMCCLLESTA